MVIGVLVEDVVSAHHDQLLTRGADAWLTQIGSDEQSPGVEQVEAIDWTESVVFALAGAHGVPVGPEDRQPLRQGARCLLDNDGLNPSDLGGRPGPRCGKNDGDIHVADHWGEATVREAAEREYRLDLAAE